jgi:hypothetical protein
VIRKYSRRRCRCDSPGRIADDEPRHDVLVAGVLQRRHQSLVKREPCVDNRGDLTPRRSPDQRSSECDGERRTCQQQCQRNRRGHWRFDEHG